MKPGNKARVQRTEPPRSLRGSIVDRTRALLGDVLQYGGANTTESLPSATPFYLGSVPL